MTPLGQKNINYGRQDIDQADIDAVISVLKSDFLTQGPAVPIFEKAVSRYCDAKYAVAVNSATSALHIACLALGVGKGDIVWTSPNTFVASANCALYCGATVDFVDIDERTYNLSVERLAENDAGYSGFSQVLADALFMPGRRKHIMKALGSPKCSDNLSKRADEMFGQVRT